MQTIKRIIEPTIYNIDQSLNDTTSCGVNLDMIFRCGSFYYASPDGKKRRNLLGLEPSDKILLLQIKELCKSCGLDREILKEHLTLLLESFPNLVLYFDDKKLLYKMREELQDDINKRVKIVTSMSDWIDHRVDADFILASRGDVKNAISEVREGNNVIIDWGNAESPSMRNYIDCIVRNVGDRPNLYAVCSKPDSYRRLAKTYQIKCDEKAG